MALFLRFSPSAVETLEHVPESDLYELWAKLNELRDCPGIPDIPDDDIPDVFRTRWENERLTESYIVEYLWHGAQVVILAIRYATKEVDHEEFCSWFDDARGRVAMMLRLKSR